MIAALRPALGTAGKPPLRLPLCVLRRTFQISRKKQPQTTKEKGDALEERVARILRDEGRWRVSKNLTLIDAHGNRSQIDVVSGLIRRTYYECKNYSPHHKVPLDDVAKFKEVLSLNNIAVSRAVFVTSSTFTPRAVTIGVRTVDGEQLKRWEKAAKAKKRWRVIFVWPAAAVACALAAVVAGLPLYRCLQLPGFDAPALRAALEWRTAALQHACDIVDKARTRWLQ